MLITPPVCAIQFLAIHIWRSHTHPVEQMVLQKLTIGVAILAVLSTMVLAPLIEEMLFRGILQRWLGRFVEDLPLPTTTSKEIGSAVGLEPENTSLLRDSGYAPPKSITIESASEFSESSNQPAMRPWSHSSNLPILLTSVFFAAMHLPQWPAPIAILLLSMALGTVYQRTGSLLASITMHAFFNGINTLLLLLAAIGQHIQAPIPPAILAFSASSFLTDILFTTSFR